MKKLIVFTFITIFFLAFTFEISQTADLTDKGLLSSFEVRLSTAQAQGLPGGLDAILVANPIEAARASEENITEIRTHYVLGSSMQPVAVKTKVVVGTYWCCTPATVQDRCYASGMCPQ